jgi:hyaluronan synthase
MKARVSGWLPRPRRRRRSFPPAHRSSRIKAHRSPWTWLTSVGGLLGIAGVCALIGWHLSIKLTFYGTSAPTTIYTIVVSSYVLSRFVLAVFYRSPKDAGLEPSVAIVVPAFNEGEAVARTIHACLGVDYPRAKLEVVIVNDGSSDDTWDQMRKAAAEYPPGAVRCIDLGRNQGKRAAMAAGIRATSAEILVFVDSDSLPARGAIRRIVQGFADRRVGAISGLTYVRNATTNLLTRMQAGRYYVSFQLLKSAESVLGAVACCSGCFSAYRRAAVTPVLDNWERQRFLGVACTYGDDRALTNRVIKTGWITRYDARAEAWTDVPDKYGKFFKQQLRWKKSWAREGPILLSHVWRSRPVAFPSILLQTCAGLLSPIVILYNIGLGPMTGRIPLLYILGLYLVSTAYALLYRVLRNDGLWLYAFAATVFYLALSPQLIWAVARIRDGSWGTRSTDELAAKDTLPALTSAPATAPHPSHPSLSSPRNLVPQWKEASDG